MKSFPKSKIVLIVIIILIMSTNGSYAETTLSIPKIGISLGKANTPREVSSSIEILFLFTILALAPSILIMMTCFTRIIIVLSFIRKAVGTQTTPPNQIMVGLALFLTFFVMAPIATEINEKAIVPYTNEQISQEEAIEYGMEPLRKFMFKQTREKDLALFVNISNLDEPATLKDIPNKVLIPAFIISELKTGFQIGFIIFIPFIMVDMVVASTLMSMGMMMLPPVMISLPFKILLFILVDGWNLIIKSLMLSFN
ncbi:MAG: flagellar type III secretion system pore protein FliP [Anaeromicrobium sp.]|jgi:flagellar biosynthetic protein FliP|uniref:flagellar type III secretion system pore protein FliP n=1 Tax=Anaeromicrobium sp. TaxID=1929132 RepID=UPI0025DCD524|nr:flagellar type III secretion system pore protein FliP [Anaeromicrobium sp.]MCT4595594.1 flagellar type III secretion system pore protein FliP [Anaeromicrobium sp.]